MTQPARRTNSSASREVSGRRKRDVLHKAAACTHPGWSWHLAAWTGGGPASAASSRGQRGGWCRSVCALHVLAASVSSDSLQATETTGMLFFRVGSGKKRWGRGWGGDHLHPESHQSSQSTNQTTNHPIIHPTTYKTHNKPSCQLIKKAGFHQCDGWGGGQSWIFYIVNHTYLHGLNLYHKHQGHKDRNTLSHQKSHLFTCAELAP